MDSREAFEDWWAICEKVSCNCYEHTNEGGEDVVVPLYREAAK